MSMKRIITTLYIFASIAVSLWAYPSSVLGNPRYTVAPLVIDANVTRRDIKEFPITITNTGSAPVTIYPTVNNISVDSGGKLEAFLPPVMSDQTRSLASWIEISRAGIDMQPGDVHVITLRLRINPNAEPGEYHAFIGFPYGGNRDEAERKLERGDAPGTVVTVDHTEKRTVLLKLAHFVVDRFVTKPMNDAITYTIRNPGEETLVPYGEVIVYDGKGSEVGAIPVNPDKNEILPGEEKVFVTSAPTEGLFGKYKAFLSVEYGSQNIASVQDTAFFYVFPLKTLLIILGAILVVVVGLSLYVHRKYFDEVVDDGSESLPLHVRESRSDPLHHDINLRKPE
jgi:hypothetical protein